MILMPYKPIKCLWLVFEFLVGARYKPLHSHLHQMLDTTLLKHLLLRGFFPKCCIESKWLNLTKAVINLQWTILFVLSIDSKLKSKLISTSQWDKTLFHRRQWSTLSFLELVDYTFCLRWMNLCVLEAFCLKVT